MHKGAADNHRQQYPGTANTKTPVRTLHSRRRSRTKAASNKRGGRNRGRMASGVERRDRDAGNRSQSETQAAAGVWEVDPPCDNRHDRRGDQQDDKSFDYSHVNRAHPCRVFNGKSRRKIKWGPPIGGPPSAARVRGTRLPQESQAVQLGPILARRSPVRLPLIRTARDRIHRSRRDRHRRQALPFRPAPSRDRKEPRRACRLRRRQPRR